MSLSGSSLVDEDQQVADACGELEAGLLEGSILRGSPILRFRRVRETPVDMLRVSRKHRAHFSHAVANGDDIVECLPDEIIQVFGALVADVDPYLGHRLQRERMDGLRLASRAEDLDSAPAERAHDALRHLRAGAVVRAQQQDMRGRWIRLWYFRLRRRVRLTHSRVDGRPACQERGPQQAQVEAVIHVASISGAAAIADDLAIAQLLQVV